MIRFLLSVLLFVFCFSSFAQEVKDLSQYAYPILHPVSGMDSYGLSVCYSSGSKVFNLRNLTMSTSAGTVASVKINPDKTSYAVLVQKRNKAQVILYDLWDNKSQISSLKIQGTPFALTYTPDGKNLLVAVDSKVLCYGLQAKYPLLFDWETGFAATVMQISPDSRFLALSDGRRFEVWDLESRTLKKRLDYETNVQDIGFSDDGYTLAILTSDGTLTTYSVPEFSFLQVYDGLGEARCCAFHPMGKYIAVVSSDTRIVLLNLFDHLDRYFIDDEEGGISELLFMSDAQDSVSLSIPMSERTYYLAYNTIKNIKYVKTEMLSPYYGRLVAEELKTRMDDWMQQMPGESLEDYQLRVSEANQQKQMRLFEEEIATRMADNLGLMPEIALGNYNPETHMLTLSLEQMPTIYLEVPEEELMDFADAGNVELRNAKYGISKNDRFELVYADVYNKASGKTYVFDNRARETLDFLETEEGYIPLDLAMQSTMEELKLEEIKSDIVDIAKKQNVISDHTDITVSSKVLTRVDSLGNKKMDYLVDFSYAVEEAYSVQEDFGAGQYKAEQSGAASSMLSIIEEAFKGEFSSYVRPGKGLLVKITGMADALPIRGRIPYDGCYGDFGGQTVYMDGEPAILIVTKESGITDNNQLAFLRAYGFKDHIAKNISAFSEMDTDYQYYVEVTEGRGGAYRRVKVQLIFMDAF